MTAFKAGDKTRIGCGLFKRATYWVKINFSGERNCAFADAEYGLCFLCGFAAAAAARGGLGGGFSYEFGGPDRGDEFLYTVIVKIDGGALEIRLCDCAHAVLLVTNRLPFR
jgi:hypothetical protein